MGKCLWRKTFCQGNQYQQSQNSSVSIIIYFGFLLLQNGIRYMYAHFDDHEHEHSFKILSCTSLGCLIIHVLFYLLSRKYPKLSICYAILAAITVYTIVEMEILYHGEVEGVISILTLNGILLLVISELIRNIAWVYIIEVFMITLFMYIYMKYRKITSIEYMGSALISVAFFNITIAHCYHKQSLLLYQEKIRLQQITESWKSAMDCLPIAIIIYKFKEIKYSNEEAKKLLKEISADLIVCESDKPFREIKQNEDHYGIYTKTVNFMGEDMVQCSIINTSLSYKVANASAEIKFTEMLVATSSHELRTPLNGIKGVLYHLKDCKVPNQQKMVQMGLDACDMQELLINDILDYSKIHTKSLQLAAESCSIRGLIECCCQLITSAQTNKSIQIRFNVESDVPEYVIIDQRRIKQIIFNLLSNSLKFTLKGYISLEVFKKDDKLYFMNTDTGVGIKKENLNKLFQPFGMLADEEHLNKNGTGLGLYLSKTLCNLMGGDIYVASTYQHGSTFTFFVPLKEETKGQTHSNRNIKYKIYQSKSALLVDDSMFNLIILESLLNNVGIKSHKYTNAHDVLDNNQDWSDSDICFIDINMPLMNGIELATEITKQQKSRLIKKMPLIALTGDSSEQLRDNCMKNGFNAFLTKPVSQLKLLELISEYIE